MAVPFLSVFFLDAWHVPVRYQSYPLGLGHHVIRHSASIADAAACLAHA